MTGETEERKKEGGKEGSEEWRKVGRKLDVGGIQR